METFFLVVFLIFVLLLFIVTLILVVGLFLSAFGWAVTRVPFVPVSGAVVGNIIEALELKENSIFYDLGSGDGRVLFAAAKRFPGAKFIGIEKAPLPLLISKLSLIGRRKYDISVVSKNFLKVSLRDATHIFTYLSPELMDELLPKFEKELLPGTRLVTCDFTFSKKAPDKEIDLDRGKFKLSRKLYIYAF